MKTLKSDASRLVLCDVDAVFTFRDLGRVRKSSTDAKSERGICSN